MPGVRQRLGAIRHLFDWPATGEVAPANSAVSVQTFQQLAVSIVPVGAIVLTGVAAGLVHWSPGLIAILASSPPPSATFSGERSYRCVASEECLSGSPGDPVA